MEVSVKVKNNGNLKGRETVQIYIKADCEDTPNAQLKAFTKVSLQPGEEKTVNLFLPAEAFALFDEQGQPSVAQGNYTVYAGGSQPDLRSMKLTGKKPLQKAVTAPEKINIR
jgi:beta-glucosidase